MNYRKKIERLELEVDQYKKQWPFLNSIYHNVDSAIFVIDVEEDGVFRYSGNNKAHQKGLGILSESFIGKTPDDLVPFVSREIISEVKQNYKRCLNKRKIIEYEEKITINNQEIWVITRLIPLKNKAGQIYRIIGISNEISERRKAESALKESEKRYHELFNKSKSGIAVYEYSEADKDFIIVDFNRVAQRIDKLIRKDLVGKGLLACFPSAKLHKLFDIFKRVDRTGKSEHHPVLFYEDDRISGWRNYYIYKLPTGEIVSVFEDITKRLKTEDELKEINIKLEKRIKERTKELSLSEEKFRSIFESSRDAIILLTTKGFFDCNSAALKLFGFEKKEEFLIQHPGSLSPKKQPNGRNSLRLANQYIRRSFNEEIPLLEWLHKRKDESLFPAEILLTPLIIDNKKAVHAVVRDISERKNAKEKIKKQERQLFMALEGANLGLWDWDIEGDKIYINKLWVEMLGYKFDEFENPFNYKFWESLVHPDDFIIGDNIFHEHVKNKTDLFETEFRMKLRSGKWIWTLIRGKVFDWKNDKPVRALGTLQDITERREAENNLKQSEEKFRMLTELSPAGISIQTTDRFLFVNPAWSEISGFPIEEALNMGPLDIIHPDMREQAKLRSDARLSGEKDISRYDLKLLTKNKKVKWVDMALSVIDFEGKSASIALSTDITKIKETQETLRKAQQKLHGIINSVHNVIFIKDRKGRYELINEAFEKNFNIKAEKVIGKNDFSIFSKDLAAKLIENDKEIIKSGKPISIEEEGYINGTYRVYLSNKVPLKDCDGKVFGLCGVGTDITQQKNIEHEIRDAKQLTEKINKELEFEIKERKTTEEELKKLIATKDKFFRIIAHDLKSPLNSLLGGLRIIEHDAGEEGGKSDMEIVRLLKLSVKQGLELLDNLMEWSSVQTGRIPFNPISFNLKEHIDTNVSLLKNLAAEKSININYEIDAKVHVFADENMISSIIRNLVSNAIKFTNREGEIKISSRSLEGFQEVSVKDSGIGVTPEQIENMFRIDKIASTIGTNGEKGTGLGLMLCKEFAEKHGGTIHLESKTNEGSCFTFTIPNK